MKKWLKRQLLKLWHRIRKPKPEPFKPLIVKEYDLTGKLEHAPKRIDLTRPPKTEDEPYSEVVAKHFKGKGRPARWYRRSIKKSPKLRVDEEE